jgi:hypothetical protein
MLGPCDKGDATRRSQSVNSTLDPLEPTIDVAPNDFGGVWSQHPKVPRTTRHIGERVGYNERLLAIGGHLGRPCQTSDDRIPLPATMLLDNAWTPFRVASRPPWSWLHHYVDPALDGEKAEAEEPAELLHPSIALSPASPLGGSDGRRTSINPLKHQFEREPLLHLDDYDQFGLALGKGDNIASPHLALTSRPSFLR